MRRFLLTSTLVTVAALAAAACTPASEGDGTAYESNPARTHAADAGNAGTLSLPEPGQPYWAARQLLLEQGFQPVGTVDADAFHVCVAEMEAGRSLGGDCPTEQVELLEVESCAGTGTAPCRTNWLAPDGRHLILFTEGEPQPGIVRSMDWVDMPDRPQVSVENACRQIVERQFGQSGDAVTFEGANISWRAPVDGGRLRFACAVDGDQVSLTRDGQVQTFSLNETADETAQEEAH